MYRNTANFVRLEKLNKIQEKILYLCLVWGSSFFEPKKDVSV